jgi:hypothetical protein
MSVVSSDMRNGRPPKVPKTAHGRPPKVPKTNDICLGNVFDEIPETNNILLGKGVDEIPETNDIHLEKVFDCACEEWTEARKAGNRHKCRLIWTEFYDTNPVFSQSFSGMQTNMTRIDTITRQLWAKQSCMQTKVEQVIIQQYCSEFSTIESQKYLNNIFSTLENEDVNGNTMSVAVCADVLFRRLAATFCPSPYKDMESWFRFKPSLHAVSTSKKQNRLVLIILMTQSFHARSIRSRIKLNVLLKFLVCRASCSLCACIWQQIN